MTKLVNGTYDRKALEEEYENCKKNYSEENLNLLRFGGLWQQTDSKKSVFASYFGDGLVFLKKNEEKSEGANYDFSLMLRKNGESENDICLSHLWLKESKKGGYLSGNFGSVKMLVFKNEYYEKPTHPYYLMYLAPKPEKVEKTTSNFELS
jgi:hypothetical protein